jgi:hypothetical protein
MQEALQQHYTLTSTYRVLVLRNDVNTSRVMVMGGYYDSRLTVYYYYYYYYYYYLFPAWAG